MSRSGSRSRNRKTQPPADQGSKGGRPRFEVVAGTLSVSDPTTGYVSPGSQVEEVAWIPEGTECEAIWMDVIIHPVHGVPCLAISLGNTAYALVPVNQAGPLLFQALQNCQAAMRMAQATAAIVGPDGRPLVAS